MAEPGEVTRLLHAYGRGDRSAFDRLVPMVYDDLRRIARRQLRRSRGETLNTTGLVHEAWIRLAEPSGLAAEDRGHFLAISARAMRQVIIAFARRRRTSKRGGGVQPLTLDEQWFAIDSQTEQLLALDVALERLAGRDEQLARVVECRFFAGLSEEETAAAMGTSLRSAQRAWMRAKAWLRRELGAAG